MRQALDLDELHVFDLPAVVTLVPRAAPPLQFCYSLVCNLIHGPKVGPISRNEDMNALCSIMYRCPCQLFDRNWEEGVWILLTLRLERITERYKIL